MLLLRSLSALLLPLVLAAPTSELAAVERELGHPIQEPDTIVSRANNPTTNGGTRQLGGDEISSWAPIAVLAGLAYCNANSVRAWTCGQYCAPGQNSGVLAAGGNQQQNPNYYVLDSGDKVVVAIAGTNPFSPASIAVDLDFGQVWPDGRYFPGANGIKLHGGFYKAFTRMIDQITPAVENAVNNGKRNVLVVGHSMGGAIGHLVSVYLTHKLGGRASVEARLIASPRVGNPAWANYEDSTMQGRSHNLIHYNDAVPHLPFLDWNFRHPSGEIWIKDNDGSVYLDCQGQENVNCQDSLSTDGLIIGSWLRYINLDVHLGPYAGVMINSLGCR